MGEPITGQWGRTYTVPYSGADKWGTGINPVHQFYGEDSPLRVYGRQGNRPVVTAPGEADRDFVTGETSWGYVPEDLAGLDVFANPEEAITGVLFVKDSHPDLSEGTVTYRANVPNQSRRPWGSSGAYKNVLRSIMRSAGNINNQANGYSYQLPTETVSEGWVNKPASGMDEGQVPYAVVSDPAQYEVQTSMRQRDAVQDNGRAVLRQTDVPRENIASRVAPMKLKIYSGEQRHYDMFPRQMDDIPRPFWYRRAGTGRIQEMAPNAMVVISPLQRTVPPDPSLGPQETTLTDDNFGYTSEDQGWY